MNPTIIKKIFRDIKSNLGANIAAVTLVTIALFVLTFFMNLNAVLELSMADFYEKTSFPHAFAQVFSAPLSANKEIERIQGVDLAEGRITGDFYIYEKELESKDYATLRLTGSDFQLGDYLVLEGKRAESDGEIVLDKKFAEDKNIQVGESIQLIDKGRITSVKIVGKGMGSENIYAVRSDLDFFPEPGKFGVAYANVQTLMNITGESGVNSFAFRFDEGYKFDNLEYLLKKSLGKYQLLGLQSADDQYSNQVMVMEIGALKGMSMGMPIMFLVISLAIEYFIIKRMVELQRGQIGLLKAIGYSKYQVLGQYIIYAAIVGVIGGVLGCSLGIIGSGPMLTLYQDYFNMPFIEIGLSNTFFIMIAIGVVLLCCITGYMGGASSLKLEPSEAMRPKEPRAFSTKFNFEKSKWIHALFTMNGRLGIRNLYRSLGRGLFIVIGISFAVAVCATPWSLYGDVFGMMYEQYNEVERYDLKLSTSSYVDRSQLLNEIKSNEISYAEALIESGISIRNEHLVQQVMAIGIEPSSQLYFPKNNKGKIIQIQQNRIYLPKATADLLHAKVGDTVLVSGFTPNYDKEYPLVIGDLTEQLVGSYAYLEIDQLNKIMGAKNVANGVIVKADDQKFEEISEKYNGAQNVAAITNPSKMLDEIMNYLGLVIMMVIYIGAIGIITGLAIIYSAFMMMISERESEITTLMVVGFDDKQIANIMGFEQWILTFIGMAVAYPVSQFLKSAVSKLVPADMFYLPPKLGISAYLAGCVVVFLAVILGHLASKRKISRLNPVDALKYRE